MKTTSLVLVASLFIATDPAQACCGRCRGRGSYARTTATYQSAYAATPAYYPRAAWAIPAYSYQPTYTYATSYELAPITMNPPAASTPVVAQPTYSYEADPNGRPAYYYTYDESGNLIIKQWMDWLFRGGRRAGMPMPPLPIVGRLGGQ